MKNKNELSHTHELDNERSFSKNEVENELCLNAAAAAAAPAAAPGARRRARAARAITQCARGADEQREVMGSLQSWPARPDAGGGADRGAASRPRRPGAGARARERRGGGRRTESAGETLCSITCATAISQVQLCSAAGAAGASCAGASSAPPMSIITCAHAAHEREQHTRERRSRSRIALAPAARAPRGLDTLPGKDALRIRAAAHKGRRVWPAGVGRE